MGLRAAGASAFSSVLWGLSFRTHSALLRAGSAQDRFRGNDKPSFEPWQNSSSCPSRTSQASYNNLWSYSLSCSGGYDVPWTSQLYSRISLTELWIFCILIMLWVQVRRLSPERIFQGNANEGTMQYGDGVKKSWKRIVGVSFFLRSYSVMQNWG